MSSPGDDQRGARVDGGQLSDEDLVAAAQAGDADAMNTLLRRHHQRIWAVCRRLAGNDADAADASQEAMILIVRRISSFDGRSRFTTWAHRVATNACLDELRRRGRRPRPGLGIVTDDGLPRPVADPVQVEAGIADRLTIDEALTSLPEEFRAPVVLRDVVGHDYAEIAQILDLAPGTVRSRIARGRARLAAMLEDAAAPTKASRPGPDGPGDDPGNQADPSRRPSSRP